MNPIGRLLVVFVAIITLGWVSSAFAVPIVYQGYDAGATSLSVATNAQAASIAFDLAAGATNIIDFDTNTSGATISTPDTYAAGSFALFGGNTTAGGSNFFGHTYTTTITFDNAIDSFGAYFSGYQRSDFTLTYNDGNGNTVILDMPVGNLTLGGLSFFGFTDIGASIGSLVVQTVLGDYVGIDDIRFGTAAAPVPEPGTLLLLGSGLAGLALYRRRMNKT